MLILQWKQALSISNKKQIDRKSIRKKNPQKVVQTKCKKSHNFRLQPRSKPGQQSHRCPQRKNFPKQFFKIKKLTNQNIIDSYEVGKNLYCTPTEFLLMTRIDHAAPSQIFDHSQIFFDQIFRLDLNFIVWLCPRSRFKHNTY